MEDTAVRELSAGRKGRPAVLIIGGFGDAFVKYLKKRGDRIIESMSPETVIAAPGSFGEEVVFTSLRMEGRLTGMDVLDAYHFTRPDLPVILSTHERSVAVVVDAMRRGAFDYVNEPFTDHDKIGQAIDRAWEALLARRRRDEMQQAIASHTEDGVLVTRSRAMAEIVRSLPAVAAGRAPVLITGESGVGKGLFALMIHRASPFAGGPFVRLNCAAVPESLLESELFGHTKGAFTGADSERAGLIRSAAGGTLFLDEITLMPLHLQARLLQALEEHMVRPVGSDREESVSFRLIAAGNEDAAKLAEDGRFRRDLYYRINTLTVHVPPLRDRREDIVLLAHHFLAKFSAEAKKEIRGFSGGATTAIIGFNWPGNVRELRNVVERAVVLDRDGLVDEDDLPPAVNGTDNLHKDALPAVAHYPVALDKHMITEEKRLITEALEKEAGNISAAARGLGIPRTTLMTRMKQLGIETPNGV